MRQRKQNGNTMRRRTKRRGIEGLSKGVVMNEQMSELGGIEELRSVDAQKAATLLGIGLRTVRRLLSNGKLVSYRVGRCVRIRVEDLRAYQKQNMRGGCV
jgi:excisionase family DNA binding protein